ncbi:MAG TPA: glycosyltransferase family 39 protein, partial [Gemmatimonadales bacterium]|nr:glycosyltransferase family 39 protein [Gemmatimonadales bacterium]
MSPSASAVLIRRPDVRVLLVLLALGVRLAWLATHQGLLGEESTYYARLGENLAAGRGWLGMREQGLQLFYPPLYPLLLAAGTWVFRSAELAGRLASLAFGSLLVLPVWSLAKRAAGARIAILAACLAAVHPLFVATSTAVLSDSTYLFFALCAWAVGLRMIEEEGMLAPILLGISAGLAYLTRPEALLFPLFLLGLSVASLVTRRAALARRCAVALGSFAVMGAPYVIWLFTLTGQIHLETKGASNFEYARRIAAGLSPSQASHQIEDDLTETGLGMQSNIATLKTLHAPLGAHVRFLLESTRTYGQAVVRTLISSPVFGAPVALALAFLGWFAAPWNLPRRWHEAYLLTWQGLVVVPLLTLQHFSERFGLSFLALLLVPAAQGVDLIQQWAVATAASGTGLVTRWTLRGVPWLVVAALLVVSLRGIPDVQDLQPSDPQELVLASWIREHSQGPERIVDAGPVVAYYAGATLTAFPYARSEVALRYLARQQVG